MQCVDGVGTCMSIRLLRILVSVSGETEEREMEIRRHGEELRIRLERDLSRLIQDLETFKNDRIKELNKIRTELQVISWILPPVSTASFLHPDPRLKALISSNLP